MDFELNDEQRQIRDTIREVAQNEFAPRAREVDEASRFPQENIDRLVELGFMGLPIPEAYGGFGADTLSYALTVEEISAACGSTGLIYAAHVSLGTSPYYLFGTEAQKKKYLPRLCSGGLGAFGLTEPHTGSDAANTRTTAERKNGSWLLNGQKMWITNGALADTVICTARTIEDGQDRGVSCFIVEQGTPGFTPGKNEPKMGLKGSVTSQLFLTDCEIPEENLLGQVGKGISHMLTILDGGRISIAAMALGLGRAALEAAVKYAHEREAFGKPIADFQAIQWKVADCATVIDAARLLIYQAAWLKDQGRRFTNEAAMAKLFASEAAEKACFESIQIHGGMGYSRELPVERYYRDNRLTEIGEGTSEILRHVIARNVL